MKYGYRLTKDMVKKLIGPCVYVILSGGTAEYVGMTTCNGIGRVFAHGHQAHLTLTNCDELRIFPCQDASEAKRIETYLIIGMRPRLNHKSRAYSGRMGAVLQD